MVSIVTQLYMIYCSYLDEVGKAGENATEFLGLFQNLTNDPQWKFYLASRGILPTIGQLITKVSCSGFVYDAKSYAALCT